MKNAVEIVREFVENVRAGVDSSNAYNLVKDPVKSHFIQSEKPEEEWIGRRTVKQLVEHVEEMKAAGGNFTLKIQDIFGDDEKVYVRWKQEGKQSNGKDLTEYVSAVYRVEDGKVAEYWLILDRKGVELQQ